MSADRYAKIFSVRPAAEVRAKSDTPVTPNPQAVRQYDDEAFERDHLYRLCIERGGEALRLAEIIRELDDAWFLDEECYQEKKRALRGEARDIARRLASERMLKGEALRAKAAEVFADEVPAKAVVAARKPQPEAPTPTDKQGGLF